MCSSVVHAPRIITACYTQLLIETRSAGFEIDVTISLLLRQHDLDVIFQHLA